MRKQCTRRTFLSAAAAGLTAPFIFPGLGRAQSAIARLQHASIGVGGMGASDFQAILASKKADIVAICDIDAKNLAKAAEALPDARQYRDWREMLEAEGDRIDSVNVSTPDHMHAAVTMSALARGKHVYCQKPLTHQVFETRQVALATAKSGRVTQMGNQIHSHDVYRTAAKLIAEGALGKIKEWHSWVSAQGWPVGEPLPTNEEAPPESVKWDLWIGVAPFRNYIPDTYHPFKWRNWKDFGCGPIGDFLCHIFDPVFMGVQPGPVLSLEAETTGSDEQTWPFAETIRYQMQGSERTAEPVINATWYDGGRKPDTAGTPLPSGYELPNSGSMVIGEEGAMVLPHWSEPVLFPEEKFKDYPKPDIGPRQDHYKTFVEACLGNAKTTSHFGYAATLTEAALLGNIASRFPGEKLDWDSASLTFKKADHPANGFIKHPYREGWAVEGLG